MNRKEEGANNAPKLSHSVPYPEAPLGKTLALKDTCV